MHPAVSRIRYIYSTNAFILEEVMIHIHKEVQETSFETSKHLKRPKCERLKAKTNGIFYIEIQSWLYSFIFSIEALSTRCVTYAVFAIFMSTAGSEVPLHSEWRITDRFTLPVAVFAM